MITVAEVARKDGGVLTSPRAPARKSLHQESMMPAVNFETRNHIAYLTLNRPEVHNSFNPETIVRLGEAWTQISADDDVRAVIITGAGKVAFSAGADLGKLIPLFTGARKAADEWDEKLLANRKLGDTALLRNFNLDKPVIAEVNGFCIAGGMELIQATDLRVASDNASFGLQEVKWAIIPAAGSLARLQRQIPYCKAMEILLTGNRIDAQEAWRLGLVNYVVTQDKLMAKAEELAATIAANGPLAVRKIKEAVRRTSGRPLEEAFKIENECAREVMRSEDAKEGPRAFMEKRKPIYKGR
jgi:enoyl-CoA hydratase